MTLTQAAFPTAISVDLVKRCFGSQYREELGLSEEEFVALGRVEPESQSEAFGLTPLAIRMCRSTNGVSRKHGEVSRGLWQGLFPGKTVDEVPITHITNGVHAPTWVAPLIRSLYKKYVGEDWAQGLHDPGRWSAAVERERHSPVRSRSSESRPV